jgi:hypothetical protein
MKHNQSLEPTVGGANHRFKFQKSRQLLIRVHNETLPVAAMCVCNPDCSPFTIHR